MKVVVSWVLELAPPLETLSPDQWPEVLTVLGLEVSGVHRWVPPPVCPQWRVARILRVAPFEETTRQQKRYRLLLSLSPDDVQGEKLEVVTADPSLQPGDLVVWVPPGGWVYDPGTLNADSPQRVLVQERTFSSPEGTILSRGMVLSLAEMGWFPDAGRVFRWVADSSGVGKSPEEVLDLSSETILELDLTPNRNDVLSQWGVARELLAWLFVHGSPASLQGTWATPEACLRDFARTSRRIPDHFSPSLPLEDQKIQRVILLAGTFRYTGIEVHHVSGRSPSPWQVQKRLWLAGFHPRNLLVDLTNYVMLELGVPLHAFDLNALQGKEIVVRKAGDSLSVRTLAGQTISLHSEDLIIADGTGTPQALAGITGLETSAVSDHTRNVFLECACFMPERIRRTIRRHRLTTEAGLRFARGVDPAMVPLAWKRYLALLQSSRVDESGDHQVQIGTPLHAWMNFATERRVFLSEDWLSGFLGIPREQFPPSSEMERIFQALGILPLTRNSQGVWFSVPLYRGDVSRKEDLAEEFLRIYGAKSVPETESYCVPIHSRDPILEEDHHFFSMIFRKILPYWVHRGFQEVLGVSFLEKEEAFQGRVESSHIPVEVLESVWEERKWLRPSLIPGILERISEARQEGQEVVRFVEAGKTFWRTEMGESTEEKTRYQEDWKMILAVWFRTLREFAREPLAGSHDPRQNHAIYFLLKGEVEAFLSRGLNIQPRFDPLPFPAQGPVVSGVVDPRLNLYLGYVHPDLLKKHGIREPVVVAEFSLSRVWMILKQREISLKIHGKNGASQMHVMDVSLLVPDTCLWNQIQSIIEAFLVETSEDLISDYRVQDIYQGERIPHGYRAITLRFRLRQPPTPDLVKTVRQKLAERLKPLDVRLR